MAQACLWFQHAAGLMSHEKHARNNLGVPSVQHHACTPCLLNISAR